MSKLMLWELESHVTCSSGAEIQIQTVKQSQHSYSQFNIAFQGKSLCFEVIQT